MLLGYARVSTKDQNLDLQLDALRSHGCEKFFTDTVSGAKSVRPGLDKILKEARPKDVIVIWKLDRLGRSLKHLVELVAELNQRNIGLRSLNDPIDTTTAQGRLVFNIFASLAEFEREIIRERTNAGLAAARARGRVGGRKPGLDEDAQRKARIAASYYEEKMPVNQIAKDLDISKATLYKYLRFRKVEIGKYEKQTS
jgi:DNA invertase Pin-like site-specific DNA recombinase